MSLGCNIKKTEGPPPAENVQFFDFLRVNRENLPLFFNKLSNSSLFSLFLNIVIENKFHLYFLREMIFI